MSPGVRPLLANGFYGAEQSSFLGMAWQAENPKLRFVRRTIPFHACPAEVPALHMGCHRGWTCLARHVYRAWQEGREHD